jgi:hypothetical protein
MADRIPGARLIELPGVGHLATGEATVAMNEEEAARAGGTCRPTYARVRLIDGKVASIEVHTGARVAANAQPREVLVSSTVEDRVAGSGLAFEDRGARQLKGDPRRVRLVAVARDGSLRYRRDADS